MGQEKWAVIDIGSNTIRLVIYERSQSGSYKEAENIKTTARLRQYLDENSLLNKDGIKLLIETLQGFKEIIGFHHIPTIFCVATATIRQSQNQEEILSAVKEQTGFDIEIYSEKDEAFCGYYAVIHSTPIETGITIDMGGGSTEITYFENRQLKHYHSFPFGSVSLKNQFMQQDRLTDQDRKHLSQFVLHCFSQLPWLKNVQVPIIAIGGSARNIAQIDQNLKKYPIAGIHQYVMSYTDLQSIQEYLKPFSIEQLQKVEGLSSDRADIINLAIEVFIRLFQYTDAPSFMFSRRGLRDGISMRNINKDDNTPSKEEVVGTSISELLIDYGVNRKHSLHRGNLAQQLFEHISQLYSFTDKKSLEKFVVSGAQLYYLGTYIDNDSSSQHTFYLLANQSIDGLLHRERVKLAFIASYKNKTLLKQYYSSFGEWFTDQEMGDIRVAGAIVKLATALDASKRGIVQKVDIKESSRDTLQINVYYSGNPFVERYELEKQLRQLEKALQKTIEPHFILQE